MAVPRHTVKLHVSRERRGRKLIYEMRFFFFFFSYTYAISFILFYFFFPRLWAHVPQEISRCYAVVFAVKSFRYSNIYIYIILYVDTYGQTCSCIFHFNIFIRSFANAILLYASVIPQPKKKTNGYRPKSRYRTNPLYTRGSTDHSAARYPDDYINFFRENLIKERLLNV